MAVKSIKLGSTDDFQRLIDGLSNSSTFLYETAKKNSVINYCIETVSQELASNDLFLAKRIADKNYVPFKNYKRYNHALAKPNDEDTQTSFLIKLLVGLLVEGKVGVVRLYKNRKPYFQVWQARYLSPRQDKDGNVVYDLNAFDKRITLDSEDVCMITKFGYDNNGAIPQSPIKSAIQEILLYNRLLQHENNHLQNGMMARGVLQQSPDSRVQYTADQLSELSRQFTDASSNLRSSDTLGLPPGLEFNPIQVRIAEEGLLELLNTVGIDAILRAFRVPRSFFDNNSDSYSTSEIQRKQFYSSVILPLMKLIEDSFNNWSALTSDTEWFQFDKSKILTAEEKEALARANAQASSDASNLANTGIASLNEMRIRAGLEPLTDEKGTPLPEAEIVPLLIQDSTQDNQDQNTDPNQGKSFYKNLVLKGLEPDGKD